MMTIKFHNDDTPLLTIDGREYELVYRGGLEEAVRNPIDNCFLTVKKEIRQKYRKLSGIRVKFVCLLILIVDMKVPLDKKVEYGFDYKKI